MSVPQSAPIVVVGAGPAGIAAAVTVAELGGQVVLVDESARPGGQIWRGREPASPAAARWLRRLDDARARVTMLTEAGVVAVDGRAVAVRLVVERDGAPIVVDAPRLILATGARERFLPFPGWTLPGVVGAGGAQALMKGGLQVAGKRVVVSGTGPLLLPVAALLARRGARVLHVLEQAPRARVARFAAGLWRAPSLAIAAARYRAAFVGAPYSTDAWVIRAHGNDRLRSVELHRGGRTTMVECDLLCTGFGLVPNTELASLLGCATEREAIRVDDAQRTSVPGILAAGECCGVAGVDAAIAEGEIAALVAMDRAPGATARARRTTARTLAGRADAAFGLRDEVRQLADDDTIVCRCEDVRHGEIDPAWSARQAKLYTRAGMGVCQGRVCGPALRAMHGWSPDSVRAPLIPAAVATLASLGADPTSSSLLPPASR